MVHYISYGIRKKLFLLAIACGLISGCRQGDQYPSRPILLICPWAAGGGTDRVSRTLAAHLESVLEVPVNVINATGGKGVTGHSRGLRARADGYTLTMATLELTMMHWSGLTDLTVDACEPLISLNEDYAALLVPSDAPWQNLRELEAAVAAAPKSLKCSGTATGGAWHLATAGWLLQAGLKADDVVWISSTGAGPSLQELRSGGLEMVCCSLPEAASLLQPGGGVRALGVMAPQRASGFPNVPTFREQGTDWSLGGWRAVVVPRGTPEPVQDQLLDALTRIVTGQTLVGGVTFPQFMEQSGFDHTYRTGEELRTFLHDTDVKLGALLTSDAMRSVNRDPYPPLAYPYLILALLAVVVMALAFEKFRAGRHWAVPARHAGSATEQATEAAHFTSGGPPTVEDETAATKRLPAACTRDGYVAFALVIGAIAAFVLLAEMTGFVLFASITLIGLAVWFGASTKQALLLTAILAPMIYHLFAHALRVPLPQGWFGW